MPNFGDKSYEILLVDELFIFADDWFADDRFDDKCGDMYENCGDVWFVGAICINQYYNCFDYIELFELF